LFEALPLAGIFSHIPSWHEFAEQVRELQKVGVINSVRDLWWDARPNADYGTLEIRVCDLPTRFSDVLGITAVIQALVATLAEDKTSCPPLNTYIIQANKWQAARHGLRGSYVDPTGLLTAGRITFKEAVQALMKFIEPMSVRLGSEHYISNINRILAEGTGADFLRRKYSESGNLQEVVQSLQGEFWQ
jgi:carboxylate-amine ligase